MNKSLQLIGMSLQSWCCYNSKTLSVKGIRVRDLLIISSILSTIYEVDIADHENQWKIFGLHHQIGEEQYGNLKVTYNLMNYV